MGRCSHGSMLQGLMVADQMHRMGPYILPPNDDDPPMTVNYQLRKEEDPGTWQYLALRHEAITAINELKRKEILLGGVVVERS